MCIFKSAIYHQQLGLLHDDYTDSHEDLINFYNIDDKTNLHKFVRLEYAPKSNEDYCDIRKYVLTVDEQSIPVWFNDDIRKECEDKMRCLVNKCIFRDKQIKCLLSGVYILCGNTSVDYIKNCRIFHMMESSNVGMMLESSNVGMMWGSSKVGVMLESSKVGVMWGSSKVGEMMESSNVGMMLESSNVGMMWGSSKVGEMRGSSNVGMMLESSKVGTMRGSSKVVNDNRVK